MIPLARPHLGDEEAKAVADVLESGMLVQGERVAAFEARLRTLTGRGSAVAVSSGTGALELALEVLEIGAGDEVLVPDLTWPSPAHAVRRRGATAILVDVDAAEWNCTAAAFVAARTDATRAAVVIDQFGAPARHGAIADALGDLPIIEDAACAIGSTSDGRPAGAFGRLACLSFHPRKIVTTAEGGAVLTDDPVLAARLRTLRNHGQEAPGHFTDVAGNLRMTDVAAAIGLCQLDRLDAILSRRRALAARYRDGLEDLPLSPQVIAPGAVGNAQTFGVVLAKHVSISRDEVVSKLRDAGIQASILSYALHRLAAVAMADDAAFPITSSIIDRGLALPLHTFLSDADQDLVLSTLRDILGQR